MDKLKSVLGWLKQNYFWLVCALLAGIAVFFTMSVTNELKQRRAQQENSIRSAMSAVKGVESTKAEVGDEAVRVHPNQSTIEGMDQEVSEALQVAAQAWKIRRSAQEGLYRWPDVLGTHKKTFEKLPWPEFIPPPNYASAGNKKAAANKADVETEIPGISAQVLEIYGREIRKVMPELAAIIGATWKYSAPAATESAAAAPSGGEPAGTDPARPASKPTAGGVKVRKDVVQWNPKDQDHWYEMVTTFRTISIEDRPTLVGAVYIQENLWLLEALFRTIKQVNGEADANDVAAIKSIDHCYFGRDAQGLTGELSPVSRRLFLQARDAKTERALKPPAAPKKKAFSQPKKAVEEPKENRFDPADRRFVDDNYEPIDATTVREAVKSETLGRNPALTVAKRVPFRIGLTMDERKIPAFLAACANSPFRFETRQIRINRHDSSLVQTVTEDANSSKDLAALEEEGGATSGGGVPTGGAGAGAAAATGLASVRTNHDVRVEFYGFVKIYNPVNYKLLQTEAEPTPPVPEPAAAAAPVANPAAPTTEPAANPAANPPGEPAAAPGDAGQNPAAAGEAAAANPGDAPAPPKAPDDDE